MFWTHTVSSLIIGNFRFNFIILMMMRAISSLLAEKLIAIVFRMQYKYTQVKSNYTLSGRERTHFFFRFIFKNVSSAELNFWSWHENTWKYIKYDEFRKNLKAILWETIKRFFLCLYYWFQILMKYIDKILNPNRWKQIFIISMSIDKLIVNWNLIKNRISSWKKSVAYTWHKIGLLPVMFLHRWWVS